MLLDEEFQSFWYLLTTQVAQGGFCHMVTEKNVYRLVIGVEKKVFVLLLKRDISTDSLNGVIYYNHWYLTVAIVIIQY